MAEGTLIQPLALFLDPPHALSTNHPPILSTDRPSPVTPATTTALATDSRPISKRKLSKSRNGCTTCKAKRLKCDETKPKCQQCARRNVVCGGYKKDFKWRAFEEMNFTGKPPAKTKKGTSPPTSTRIQSPGGNRPTFNDSQSPLTSPPPAYMAFPNSAPAHGTSSTPAPSLLSVPTGLSLSSLDPRSLPPIETYNLQASSYVPAPSPISPVDTYISTSFGSSTSGCEVLSEEISLLGPAAPSSISSGQSPRLLDLLLPGTDLSVPPEEYNAFRSQYPESFYDPFVFTPPAEDPPGDEIVEEVPRMLDCNWVARIHSQGPSTPCSPMVDPTGLFLPRQLQFQAGSPEALIRFFNRDTCGILSVKNGPTENPWRTLIWPLVHDCPALYHAIASMTFFHHARDYHAMHIQGLDHVQICSRALREGLESMHPHAAISTTLVLAFAESWDQHISTGKNHIKGAKILIDQALVRHSMQPVRGDDLTRLRFLCNSWLYMDVIARLTSGDSDESDDFDAFFGPLGLDSDATTQLDPLMGCAMTLFPIIGRVANLIRRVRRSASNTPTIISQAVDLKRQLENWAPPAFIEDPEDETTSPTDLIKTAAAYRTATLLYLHQAVPEVPSLPSAVLAEQALCELAAVCPASRSVIVHIYPLMAAGCEATSEETRQWVKARWDMMGTRMKLGIIEKCLKVTQEVWSRRDAYAEGVAAGIPSDDDGVIVSPTSPPKRGYNSASEDSEEEGAFSWLDIGRKRRAVHGAGLTETLPTVRVKREGRRRSDEGVEVLAPEFTVKGHLHWLGVMVEWGWEILLG